VADPPQRESSEDVLDVLRDRLLQAVRSAERLPGVSVSAHTASFALDVFGHRTDFQNALTILRRIESEDHHDLFIREFERTYRRNPARLVGAEHRSELLVNWIEVFLQTLSEVEEILDSADEYATVAQLETDEDRDYRRATRLKTATRWRNA
jgi:hypothetical protein